MNQSLADTFKEKRVFDMLLSTVYFTANVSEPFKHNICKLLILLQNKNLTNVSQFSEENYLSTIVRFFCFNTIFKPSLVFLLTDPSWLLCYGSSLFVHLWFHVWRLNYQGLFFALLPLLPRDGCDS